MKVHCMNVWNYHNSHCEKLIYISEKEKFSCCVRLDSYPDMVFQNHVVMLPLILCRTNGVATSSYFPKGRAMGSNVSTSSLTQIISVGLLEAILVDIR